MKISYKIGLATTLLALIVSVSSFSSAHSTYSSKDANVGIMFGTFETSNKTVTFYLPNSSDSTCLNYITTEVQVEQGQTFNSVSKPSTNAFSGFSFQGWYTNNNFSSSFGNNTVINDNVSVYAKFTRNNVLFDGSSTYFTSSNNDQTVDSQYVYKISSQVWGITPTTNNSNKVDLLSSSGIYKMTYSNSTWTILRKVGFSAKDTSWWGNDNYVTWAYGQPEDRNSWGDKYWSGTLSTGSAYVSSTQKGTVYIDYTCPYIGAVRYAPNATADLSNGNTRPTNNTNHISLNNGYKYSKDTIYLYIYNNGSEVGWGNGN